MATPASLRLLDTCAKHVKFWGGRIFLVLVRRSVLGGMISIRCRKRLLISFFECFLSPFASFGTIIGHCITSKRVRYVRTGWLLERSCPTDLGNPSWYGSVLLDGPGLILCDAVGQKQYISIACTLGNWESLIFEKTCKHVVD